MDSETHNNSLQQTVLALQFTLIIAVVSTVIIYMIDRFMLNHSNFGPLTEFQFYGILFIVVFGLVAGLLFYQEEKDETGEEFSRVKVKMSKKKAKKSKKN